jgi:putative transposase
MRKSRFSESQIVAILNEHDAGVPTAELARKHGIHANTLRLWKAKYGGMDAAGLARLKQLEDENARMRRIIANQTLEIDAMKNVISKNGLGPSQRKDAVKALMAEGLSERAACRLAACPRRTFQYRIRRLDDPRIGERMRAIAAERPRFGWRRINVMLQREGIVLNHKKLRRIYRAEQLQVRARKKRRVRFVRGVKVAYATRPNERWSVDFLHDTLANGGQI